MAALSAREKNHLLAIIDIGSGHIGCAILAVPKVGPGRILSHARSLLSLEERTPEQSTARLAEEIAEAAHAALEVALREAPGAHVGTVHAVLHAPWTSSSMLQSSAVFEQPTIIREALIARLAQEQIAHDSSLDRTRAFEASVLSIRLNGYPTTKPEGKRAMELSVASIVSVADAAVRATAEAAIQNSFPAARIVWRSSVRVDAALLHYMQETPDALIIDVGVPATHFIVLRDGILSAEHVVPEGLQQILTKIGGARPAAETLGLLRMIGREACADDACKALEQAIAVAEPELVRVFGEALSVLAQKRRLPNRVIVVAEESIAPWLDHFFERIDFTQFTETASPLRAAPLTQKQLSRWLVSEIAPDMTIAMAAANAVIEEQST